MMPHIMPPDNEVLLRIRKLMEQEHLSQRDLAARIGISQGHLSKVLRRGFGPRARISWRLENLSVRAGVRPKTLLPRELEHALFRVTNGSAAAMRTLTQMMHLLAQLQRIRRRKEP
jgi:transcriptional regulator with XRE-family HTH domain